MIYNFVIVLVVSPLHFELGTSTLENTAKARFEVPFSVAYIRYFYIYTPHSTDEMNSLPAI